MLVANRLGRVPVRVLHLLHDFRRAERRVPIHLADADRVAPDLRRLAFLRRRKIVQTVLRQVDDDAFARRHGQDAMLGQFNLYTRTRQPRIYARVRVEDFLVAESMLARDVDQGIFMPRQRGLLIADQVARLRRQQVLVRVRRNRAQHQHGTGTQRKVTQPGSSFPTHDSRLTTHQYPLSAIRYPLSAIRYPAIRPKTTATGPRFLRTGPARNPR